MRPYKCVKCGGNRMKTECQKPKEIPAKCALCSGQHTANYKGCIVYRDLQNAKNNLTNRKQQIPNRQTITQNNTNHANIQNKIRTSTSYSQVLNGNNNNNQTALVYNSTLSSTNSRQCSPNSSTRTA